jgi:hypothetical protein
MSERASIMIIPFVQLTRTYHKTQIKENTVFIRNALSSTPKRNESNVTKDYVCDV